MFIIKITLSICSEWKIYRIVEKMNGIFVSSCMKCPRIKARAIFRILVLRNFEFQFFAIIINPGNIPQFSFASENAEFEKNEIH